jgi:hypothetical protein
MALTYPIPQIIPEEFVDAADWNALVDTINFLANPPACRVYRSTTQSLANNTTVALGFDLERTDWSVAPMHDTAVNNTRITIPAGGAGMYAISGHVILAGDTDYISIVLQIRVNGTTMIAPVRDTNPGVSANQRFYSISTQYELAAGDYLELVVTQENTSAAANLAINSANQSPEFAATWIGLAA